MCILHYFNYYLPDFVTAICLGFIFASEKAMAPHSSTLAWKIPWTKEPGRLPSMGSCRVGHDWSDLAAAAGLKTFPELPWFCVCLCFSSYRWPHACRTILTFVPWRVFCHLEGLPSSCSMLVILNIWFVFHILDPSGSTKPLWSTLILISFLLL